MNLRSIFSFHVVIITIIITKCNGQSGGMVAISEIKDVEEDSSQSSLNKLKSIEDLAKNISHSKGSIIKSKEGNLEYRRSFISKVELQVNSMQLQEILAKIKNNTSETKLVKSNFLDSLDILESLVHQYDVGKEFIELGGFKLILSLTMNEDNDIAKAAFSVLSAALQGNKEVQKYAITTDLLKCIIVTFNGLQMSRVNSALFALSAFIRNNPTALTMFIEEKGIYSLSILLENFFDIEKIVLRIIDILGDMSADLYDGKSYTLSVALFQLQKTFAAHVQENFLCDQIINVFYKSKKFTAREKIISAFNNMFGICKEVFNRKSFIFEIKTLIEFYNPFKSTGTWYTPDSDIELSYGLFQELKEFYKKIVSFDRTNIEFEMKHMKMEL